MLFEKDKDKPWLRLCQAQVEVEVGVKLSKAWRK